MSPNNANNPNNDGTAEFDLTAADGLTFGTSPGGTQTQPSQTLLSVHKATSFSSDDSPTAQLTYTSDGENTPSSSYGEHGGQLVPLRRHNTELSALTDASPSFSPTSSAKSNPPLSADDLTNNLHSVLSPSPLQTREIKQHQEAAAREAARESARRSAASLRSLRVQSKIKTARRTYETTRSHPGLSGSLSPPDPAHRTNFSPGPTGLPRTVMAMISQSLERSLTGGISSGGGMEGQEGMDDKEGRLSGMFLSHRSPEFAGTEGILKRTVRSMREVMNIPDGPGDLGYDILFLHGGGHGQFASVPLNLCSAKTDKATYLVSGTWSSRAVGEGSKYCTPHVISSVDDEGNYFTFPSVDLTDPSQVDPESKFVYLCTNETVNGIEVFDLPTGERRSPVPLILDASSDYTTKPIPWVEANVGILFACASKNIGHPGVTAVIIRRDLLDRPSHEMCPAVFHYKTQVDADNLWNTTATFNVEVVGMMMDWIAREGGIHAMDRTSQAKAEWMYRLVEESDGFYAVPPVSGAHRSRMNVPFAVVGPAHYTADESNDLTERFLIEAWEEGIVGLRTLTPFGVGRYLRASLYHGVSIDDVQRLVEFMNRFRCKEMEQMR